MLCSTEISLYWEVVLSARLLRSKAAYPIHPKSNYGTTFDGDWRRRVKRKNWRKVFFERASMVLGQIYNERENFFPDKSGYDVYPKARQTFDFLESNHR